MRMKGNKPIFNYDDTFSLDMTLNPIIAAGLKKFKEVVISKDFVGYPVVFECSDEIKETFKNEREGYCDDISKNEWIRVIDRMIFAFEADSPEIPDNLLRIRNVGEPDEKGNQEVKIDILDQEAHDRYNWLEADYERKVQEGIELFSKYYKNLWW